jgi:PAS domain S-box-containing protein/putative nucleotidyltransferase with HDIG domain
VVEHDVRSSTSEADRYARALVEVSRNPLVSIDPEGRLTDVNAATVEAVGIPRDQLIGSDFADCFSEPEKARAAYRRVLEDGLLSDYRLVLRHVSGALTDVEYNAAVYRDAGGELRAVFAAARNAAEAQEAREQVARLALVAASLHDAIFSRDLEGTITSWNAAAEALYGYAAEEAIGRDATILLTPGHQGETKALMKRMLRDDRGFGFETQHLRRDGSQVDVVLSLSPFRDAEGEITGITIISHDVGERVRAERELRESEQKFSAAFQASPDLMMITRLSDGLLLEINEGFTRLLGYERAETVGRTTSELSIWAEPQTRATFVATLEASGESGETETVLRRKDGTVITGVHSARAMEVQGEATVLSVVRDITERTQAEEALRQNEQRYETFINATDDMVFLKDDKLCYVLVNEANAAYFGLSVDEVIGRTDTDLMPTEAAARCRLTDVGALESRATVLSYEEVDGRTYETRKFPVVLAGDRVGVGGYVRDITERTQAEQARRESEARYRGYVDNAPYGVFVSDENGRYLEVNKAAAVLTGYSQEELVQLSIADVVAPQSRDWGRHHFARLLRTGHASGDGVFLRKDGTSFTARVDAVRLATTRYLGFIVDISEQTRAAAELAASAEQVRQALTATVAALGATTELRDPYTAGHQRRVAELAGAIAAGLGWDAARIEIVTTAGLLHDVGKIIVPAEILARPGRLSELEMEIIRGHAAASAALITGIEFGGPVAAVVNQHHERLDGSGYPQGLRGENILPEARILAVADVVEAMSSHRPYRSALGIEVALAEVREHAGVKFDADVVTVCGRLVEEQGFQFTP